MVRNMCDSYELKLLYHMQYAYLVCAIYLLLLMLLLCSAAVIVDGRVCCCCYFPPNQLQMICDFLNWFYVQYLISSVILFVESVSEHSSLYKFTGVSSISFALRKCCPPTTTSKTVLKCSCLRYISHLSISF